MPYYFIPLKKLNKLKNSGKEKGNGEKFWFPIPKVQCTNLLGKLGRTYLEFGFNVTCYSNVCITFIFSFLGCKMIHLKVCEDI